MWAVVPVKDMAGAKERLAPVLGAGERRELFRAMLGDVLGALSGAPSLDGIALITRDPEAGALGCRFGAEIIAEGDNRGQTAAVSHGISRLMARGVAGIMQVPGDVPLATAAEFEQVIAAHLPAPAMTIVPARDEQGSNCVLCSPPDAVPLRFGDNSFFPHLDAAQAAGIEPTVCALPGLGLDIDTPDDLAALMARPADTLSHAYLAESGIAARLQQERDDGAMTAAAAAATAASAAGV
ncbi:MAG: 2-phospho-L-lactate guanylyltransferase [Alphaproteobacteria bacterium]|jgi:2-phospho-L-lactate guanylyltransferase|nr:2-phospho-L-lactate guanylyltransferase [Alphaproteobacteria bacterium]MDP6819309.1 2-phospho-L-lactate guanylyltransferase [Alphaproteobacteria bacterium]